MAIRDWGTGSRAGHLASYGQDSPTMLVYLVRHGHSQNLLSGADEQPTQANVSLTPLGEAQSWLVARRLHALGVDRLVASPMVRAIETARIVAAEVGLSVEVWQHCHEYRTAPSNRCCGARELRARFPDLILPSGFPEDDWEYGDESLVACVERADDFLEWLVAEAASSKARRLAVVGHSAFARIVLGRILGAEPAEIRRVAVENASLTTLEVSSRGFRVLGVNDRSHLAGPGQPS